MIWLLNRKCIFIFIQDVNMVNTIHSEEYCRKRLKELKEKNGGRKEWSLGDSLLYENFTRILKEYKEEHKKYGIQCV